MQETIGFHMLKSLGAAAFIIAGFSVIGLMLLWLRTLKPLGNYVGINVLLWVVLSAILGCIAGEALLQRDEASFAREAKQFFARGGAAQVFSRGRAWPNRGTSLVAFRSGQMHATD